MYEGFEEDYGTPLYADGKVALYKEIRKPAIKWLVDGLLKEKGIGLLYGSSGSMKSYSAVDLACRMANGMDFHGKVMQKMNVIYVAGEASDETAERIEAWCEYHHMDEKPFLQPWALDIHKSEDMDALKRLTKKIGNVGLVVFDNLADCTAGVKLSDPDDVGEKIKPQLLSFVQQTKAAVLILHHTGHDQGHERGARVLRDMTDTTIKAKKEANMFDVTWKIEKLRRMGPQPEIHFHIEDISDLVDIPNIAIMKSGKRSEARKIDVETGEILEETPENVVELRTASERLEAYLDEQGGRALVSDVLEYFDWKRPSGKPKSTYYDAVNGSGRIEKDADSLILVPTDDFSVGTAAD